MTIPALIAISLLGAAAYLWDGIQHALLYNYHGIVDDLLKPSIRRQRFLHKKLKWWNDNVHRSGNLMHISIGALMFVGALGWTGTSWQGVVSAVLISGTYYYFGDPFRQTFINAGSGNDEDQPSWWQIPVGFVVFLMALALSA